MYSIHGRRELEDIGLGIEKDQDPDNKGAACASWSGIKSVFKETFLIKAHLRRVQQSMLCHALAQLPAASSITSRFVPLLGLVGANTGDSAHSLFLTGMYSFAKLVYDYR